MGSADALGLRCSPWCLEFELEFELESDSDDSARAAAFAIKTGSKTSTNTIRAFANRFLGLGKTLFSACDVGIEFTGPPFRIT